jgi:hypothetical protein
MASSDEVSSDSSVPHGSPERVQVGVFPPQQQSDDSNDEQENIVTNGSRTVAQLIISSYRNATLNGSVGLFALQYQAHDSNDDEETEQTGVAMALSRGPDSYQADDWNDDEETEQTGVAMALSRGPDSHPTYEGKDELENETTGSEETPDWATCDLKAGTYVTTVSCPNFGIKSSHVGVVVNNYDSGRLGLELDVVIRWQSNGKMDKVQRKYLRKTDELANTTRSSPDRKRGGETSSP